MNISCHCLILLAIAHPPWVLMQLLSTAPTLLLVMKNPPPPPNHLIKNLHCSELAKGTLCLKLDKDVKSFSVRILGSPGSYMETLDKPFNILLLLISQWLFHSEPPSVSKLKKKKKLDLTFHQHGGGADEVESSLFW